MNPVSAGSTLHIPIAYSSILSPLTLAGGALILMLLASVLPRRNYPGLWAGVSGLCGALSLAYAILGWFQIDHQGVSAPLIGGQIIHDRFSALMLIIIASSVTLTTMICGSYLRRERLEGVETYILILLSGSGAMLMAESGGLIMLFLGLEIMSIGFYILTALNRKRAASGEAGLKYFVLGAFSSAVFLYGVALMYGATGSTQFGDIASFFAKNVIQHDGVALAGMLLIVVGLGFKVAAVPFHFWAPDVYEGAPTPFAGYMASVAKAAGFAGLIRVLVQTLPTQVAYWRPAIWVLCVASIVFGALGTLTQKNVKRMLAYSSISQAGYVLIGVQAATAQGTAAVLFYLLTYSFVVIGSFAVVGVIQGQGESHNQLGVFRGLARRSPLLAGAMLIFLLAQAGVPLTSGFLAKFYVIQAIINVGGYPLAIIAMLAAAVAAFAYLRLALLMYLPDRNDEIDLDVLAGGLTPVASLDSETVATAAIETVELTEEDLKVPPTTAIALAVCVAVTLFAGMTEAFIHVAKSATLHF